MLRPRRQVGGGRGAGQGEVEEGLKGVLAERVDTPADALHFIVRGRHRKGAEPVGRVAAFFFFF